MNSTSTTRRRMIRRIPCVAATLVVAGFLASPASAHSLKELEDQLSSHDKYFQAVDRPAPDFDLVDALGNRVRLSDYRDKVVVLNFIYASCGDVCPFHSQLIVRLQSLIAVSPMKDQVMFISITTDPALDRGPVLTEYGAAQGLDPVNWVFLTSPPDQPDDTTRKVAKAYGLEFTEVDGVQMHGVVTHVIDREGRLRGRFHGLGFEPVSLVTFANALVNDVHKPGEGTQSSDRTPFSWILGLFGGRR